MTVQELQQLKLKVERAKSEYDMAMGRLQSPSPVLRQWAFLNQRTAGKDRTATGRLPPRQRN